MFNSFKPHAQKILPILIFMGGCQDWTIHSCITEDRLMEKYGWIVQSWHPCINHSPDNCARACSSGVIASRQASAFSYCGECPACANRPENLTPFGVLAFYGVKITDTHIGHTCSRNGLVWGFAIQFE